MSGWLPADKYMELDVGDDNPAMNNITGKGQLPSDQIPVSSKHHSLNQTCSQVKKYC